MKIYVAAIFVFLMALQSAFALSGKTADGCTYKVINGQYLTSCDPKAAPKAQAPLVASADPATTGSYGDVPMRNAGPAPSQIPTITINTPPPSPPPAIREDYETERKRTRDTYMDSAYVGIHLGSTSVGEAGSSTGLGLTLGTSVDEHYGFEMGYGYNSMSIGLGNRGSGTVNAYSRPDATLKTHLLTGEVQGFLTDPMKRLRPFLGLGFGWKSSTLKELNTSDDYGITRSGSLSQTAIGGVGSVGTKFRIGDTFQVGFSLRYFLPIARQDAQLTTSKSEMGTTDTRLSKSDDNLTGSGLTQFQAGLQYFF